MFHLVPALFVFRISNSFLAYSLSSHGETASLTNRLSGSELEVSPRPEIEVGDTPGKAIKVVLTPENGETTPSKMSLRYRSTAPPMEVSVVLEADPKWPVLHKTVDIKNLGQEQVRVLNVVLDRAPLGNRKSEGGARGFPLYLDGQFFLSLTHPAGFAHVEGKDAVLRQYPGAWLAPGETFRSMEATYGVAKKGKARPLFVSYVRSRMARVVYGQDKPYAVLESFGGQPDGNFKNDFDEGVSESYLLKHLDDVAEAKQENGVQFDFYSLEFWHERSGDLTVFNRKNFPNGFDQVRDKILGLGMRPALWIDSGRLPDWTVDQNPAVAPCFTVAPGKGSLCRASEPIDEIYKHAYLYQMATNKVGLVKFDNLAPVCDNPAHDHLPGPLYSTEAIYNGLIDFFQTLRDANPKIFIMLYWGYHSPWWLQYGDTYFECGDDIEAASPAQYPTPYARDSVTQRLDQAQTNITDTPWLGKDSLGVWLSDWTWNSGIGKARWQEGVIMDMARGGLLFQLWTDTDFLTPPERDQVATFIDLMKANADCFDNCHFILGDPHKAEPYGYACTNGRKAFFAVDNACLRDSSVSLDAASLAGLKPGAYDLYRWYPSPAQVARATAGPVDLHMRPYEVALYEAVPVGTGPSLGRTFAHGPEHPFAEPTKDLVSTAAARFPTGGGDARWTPLGLYDVHSAEGAVLKVQRNGSVLATGPDPSFDTYSASAKLGPGKVTGIMLDAMPDPSLPAHGPGRAVNGNLAIDKVEVEIDGKPVKIKSAEADFEQPSYGGWPASATIDGDPNTGWSVFPKVGREHVIVWTFAEPIELTSAATLSISITGDKNGHNVGKFRIYAASGPPSIPVPYRSGTIDLKSAVPPSKTGGLLLIIGGDPDNQPSLKVNGDEVSLSSVWAKETNWSCPWTAWRAAIDPSKEPRTVSVTVDHFTQREANGFKLVWLPK